MPDLASARILVGADLEGAGPYINTKAQQIVGELHRLRSDLAPLIDEWIAQSATAYQDRMHEWDVAAVGLFGDREDGGILGTIAQAMNINYQNYVATEEANLQTWQSSH
ncbi:WXG100 family type VII secretion target [Streptomyces sp. NPDC005122]